MKRRIIEDLPDSIIGYGNLPYLLFLFSFLIFFEKKIVVLCPFINFHAHRMKRRKGNSFCLSNSGLWFLLYYRPSMGYLYELIFLWSVSYFILKQAYFTMMSHFWPIYFRLCYRNSSELSTRDLQKMVQALPQYSEQIDKLSLHVEVSFL